MEGNALILLKVRLDREQLLERQFRIQVRAVDKGVPQREGGAHIMLAFRLQYLFKNEYFYES